MTGKRRGPAIGLMLVCAFLAGCGPLMAVVPRGGAPAVASNVGGVQLTVHAAQWDADPSDLPERAHAVFVEIYNSGPYPVRVQLADFFLVEQGGMATRPQPGAAFAFADPGELPGEMLLAHRGHGFGGFRGGSRMRGFGVHTTRRRGVRYSPYTRQAYRATYWRAHRWHRWALAPYPYYRLGRAYRFRPYMAVPVIAGVVGPEALALTEGVIEPGGRLAGFLYFPHAPGAYEQALDLGWDVVAEAPAAPPPAPDIDDENAPDPAPMPTQPQLVGLGRLQLPLESVDLR